MPYSLFNLFDELNIYNITKKSATILNMIAQFIKSKLEFT